MGARKTMERILLLAINFRQCQALSNFEKRMFEYENSSFSVALYVAPT